MAGRHGWLATAVALTATALTAGCAAYGATPGSAGAPASKTPTATASGDIDALLTVDGRQMHLVCVGRSEPGRPTVVLESGLGDGASQWSDVLDRLAPTTRACAYDRAGEGTSDVVPRPRTTADQVADLHALLGAGGVAPPYVVAGHSLGAWNAILFASTYRAEMSGLLLVEARPPAASRRWLAELPPQRAGESEALAGNRDEFTRFETTPELNDERLDLASSAREVEAAGGLGGLPVVVLSLADGSTFWEGLDPALAARLERTRLELVRGLARLSSRSTLVLTAGTDHDLPRAAPDEVATSIENLVRQAPAG